MKTIKLRNFEVEGILNVLEQKDSILYTNDPSKKLPITILWDMDENVEKLRSISTRIKKKREEIEREYADDEHSFNETAEDGTVVRKVSDKYLVEFGKKISELMTIENEIDIKTIDVEVLENYDFIPSDYRSIRFMLEKKEDEKDETEN